MSMRHLGWPTTIALLLALVCLLIALFSGSPMGGSAFWPLSAIGLVLVAYELVRNRRWWLLTLVPFLLAPLLMTIVLVTGCFWGDCL